MTAQLRLANESPLLVVNEESVRRVNAHLLRHPTEAPPSASAQSFRPNLVLQRVGEVDGDCESDSSACGGAYGQSSERDVAADSEVRFDSEGRWMLEEDSWQTLEIFPRGDDNHVNGHARGRYQDQDPGHDHDHDHVNDVNNRCSTSAISVRTPTLTNPRPSATLRVMGPCQRCQMICIDPTTAVRSKEPYTTLAKWRNVQGKVHFGVHTALASEEEVECGHVKEQGNGHAKGLANGLMEQPVMIRVGDVVRVRR